jgi:hypothetical protein
MFMLGKVSVVAYHGRPLDGLPKTDEECLLAKAVTKHSVCERRQDVEDDCHADEDLPGCDVVLIDFISEQTDKHVVG